MVNRSIGTVRDIVWKAGQDPLKDMPVALIVQFDRYTSPLFEGTQFVPIFSATCKFEYERRDCTRVQFPIRTAFAITVYKSQGLTLPKVVLNLDKKDFAIRLSYVAISQVKKLSCLLFETSFDLERFKLIPSHTTRDRDADVVIRNQQCI